MGTAGLRMLAFKSGLTGELRSALRVPGRQVLHDRGQVLTDLGVMIADGGTAIRHIRTLRDQGELFGPVASAPTAWRALQEVTPRQRDKLAAARAKTRRRVWELITARHGSMSGPKTRIRLVTCDVVARSGWFSSGRIATHVRVAALPLAGSARPVVAVAATYRHQ
ncbi:hypothetical protein [Acrocarpospora pleiomorpha]|uniref:hypothetical protein n=1 Tax=Acrocarpospora pleiomorpha TaxID=90975 RepID=UPI00147828CC|nr:hypothetical protein [Acrocarpospora pleiomorpha]